jgi:hypothetical protein
MAERRQSKRTRTILSGKIIFNNRMSVLDCVVNNMSSSEISSFVADSNLSCFRSTRQTS